VKSLVRLGGRLRSFDRLSVAGAVIVALEVALIAVVIVSTFRFQAASDERVESLNTVGSVFGVYVALIDAESGQRGYVITGQDTYLDPYRSGISTVDTQMEGLRKLVAGNATEEDAFAQLESLVSQKRAELQQPIDLRQAGDFAGAQALVINGPGRQLMEDIRAQLTRIYGIEARRLQSATDDANHIGILIGVAAVVLSLVTLVIVGWLVLIIRRSRAAAALRQIAQAKDEFVGFVSHELRTPIAVIAGNAHLLEAGALTDPERENAIAAIAQAGDRLQAIVTTLLNLAKAEAGVNLPVEPILVHRVADAVRRTHLESFPKRSVVLEADNDIPPVMGDRSAIEQVLINLLSNAEKYGDPAQPIHIGITPNHKMVAVSVWNAGGQVDPTEFSRVFDPFFRMSSQAEAVPGVGLGLTVCHRLISAQGGRLAATPLPSGGAAFSFELPIANLGAPDAALDV
jgi:signal transduction histidine kinase